MRRINLVAMVVVGSCVECKGIDDNAVAKTRNLDGQEFGQTRNLSYYSVQGILALVRSFSSSQLGFYPVAERNTVDYLVQGGFNRKKLLAPQNNEVEYTLVPNNCLNYFSEKFSKVRNNSIRDTGRKYIDKRIKGHYCHRV